MAGGASAFGDRAVLQRRLAAARRRRQGRHLRQRRRGGGVSDGPNRHRRATARRQQAQLHADLPGRPAAAGERLLVGDHVRRQDAVADQEPDRPLPHQLADAAPAEEERRTARSRSTSRRTRRARTRNPTGCPHRTARFTWSCACTGRRRSRPRSCRPAKAPGNRRGSCR